MGKMMAITEEEFKVFVTSKAKLDMIKKAIREMKGQYDADYILEDIEMTLRVGEKNV